jgi:uncharacterized protein YqjF (DUF2071 family)
MSCEPSGSSNFGGDDVRYTHVRRDSRGNPAELAVLYGPRGDAFTSARGSLEHWLTERYCLYTIDARGNAMRGDIHHRPWPLQPAEAEFSRNTLARAHGFELPERAPLLHFARRLEMVAWPIVPVDR